MRSGGAHVQYSQCGSSLPQLSQLFHVVIPLQRSKFPRIPRTCVPTSSIITQVVVLTNVHHPRKTLTVGLELSIELVNCSARSHPLPGRNLSRLSHIGVKFPAVSFLIQPACKSQSADAHGKPRSFFRADLLVNDAVELVERTQSFCRSVVITCEKE